MMWAATVRRCPPAGHTRHPSQFGARMQLARALNHAPYLICDGVYPCPPHFDNSEIRYGIPCSDPHPPPAPLHEPDIICDHVVDADSYTAFRRNSYNNPSLRRGSWAPNSSQQASPQSMYRARHHTANLNETPYITYPRARSASQGRRSQEMRVELPYSRREFEIPQEYHTGEPIVRRYEDFRQRERPDEDGVVGLSYQQRSISGPYGDQVWGAEPNIDCWGDRPLLLQRGRRREIVRTFFVVSLSLTCIVFVIMGFGVSNTEYFLFFVKSLDVFCLQCLFRINLF